MLYGLKRKYEGVYRRKLSAQFNHNLICDDAIMCYEFMNINFLQRKICALRLVQKSSKVTCKMTEISTKV